MPSAQIHSCLIGGGLLAQLWAHMLRQSGHSLIVLQKPVDTPPLHPPHLALADKTLQTLQRWGISVGGIAVEEMQLYAGLGDKLLSWKGSQQPLGMHVPYDSLHQALPKIIEQQEATVTSVFYERGLWHINTNVGTITSHFCWDLSGLSAPLRLALCSEWAFLELEAFQARIFEGVFPSLKSHTAYQFHSEGSLWAFLPLEEGRHYGVHTFRPHSAASALTKPLVSGDFKMLAQTPPRPIAAIKEPFHAHGALLGHSAYLGHPNVAATFNQGVSQLHALESFLRMKRPSIDFLPEMNQKFDSQTQKLKWSSWALGSPFRELLPFIPQTVLQQFLRQFP